MSWSGGCLCGTVRYETRAEPQWVGHCHCRWCQKHTGAAFATWVMFRSGDIAWAGARPAVYTSSSGIERGFCPSCGSTLTFTRLEQDELSVCAGSLDDPNAARPRQHIFAAQQCGWLHLDDGLPSCARFPPGAEGREPR